MDGHRVEDGACDAARFEVSGDPVTIRVRDRVLVIHVLDAGAHLGRGKVGQLNMTVLVGCVGSTTVIAGGQVLKFDP